MLLLMRDAFCRKSSGFSRGLAKYRGLSRCESIIFFAEIVWQLNYYLYSHLSLCGVCVCGASSSVLCYTASVFYDLL